MLGRKNQAILPSSSYASYNFRDASAFSGRIAREEGVLSGGVVSMSAIGTKQTLKRCQPMSAFGVTAAIT